VNQFEEIKTNPRFSRTLIILRDESNKARAHSSTQSFFASDTHGHHVGGGTFMRS